jgi:ribose 5-phosphate isomerase B
MQLYLGSDHAGLDLKNTLKAYLTQKKFEFEDLGCYDSQSVDYPDITKCVVQKVLQNHANKGLLVCGSGIGMSIGANRFAGIFAALCFDPYTASMSRKHNNANVLCLGARVLKPAVALEILDVWLKTDFEGGRHTNRIKKIDED